MGILARLLMISVSFYLDDSSIGDKYRARGLNTIIELGIRLGPRTLVEIRKSEVKEFLHVRRTEDGIWERITKDPEGRWVNTYNLKLAFCRRFIGWYYNRDKDEEEEWVTPEWFKIKNEQSDRSRKGPYSKRQIWTRDDVLFNKLKEERDKDASIAPTTN